MNKNKKSEMSIGLIVAAVIGLIILVVVVVMVGGKLGSFGKGANEGATCQNACVAMGKTAGKDTDEATCKLPSPPGTFLPEKFGNIFGCCCF